MNGNTKTINSSVSQRDQDNFKNPDVKTKL